MKCTCAFAELIWAFVAPQWVTKPHVLTQKFQHTPCQSLDPTHNKRCLSTRSAALNLRTSVVHKIFKITLVIFPTMRGSRKFFQRGQTLTTLFFFWLGERWSKNHYKWAIIGLPTKRHLNDVSLACQWWLGSFVVFSGSGPVLLKKTTFLWFFSGGGDVLTPCPLSASAYVLPLKVPLVW